jgi:hypothetical protein
MKADVFDPAANRAKTVTQTATFWKVSGSTR